MKPVSFVSCVGFISRCRPTFFGDALDKFAVMLDFSPTSFASSIRPFSLIVYEHMVPKFSNLSKITVDIPYD